MRVRMCEPAYISCNICMIDASTSRVFTKLQQCIDISRDAFWNHTQRHQIHTTKEPHYYTGVVLHTLQCRPSNAHQGVMLCWAIYAGLCLHMLSSCPHNSCSVTALAHSVSKYCLGSSRWESSLAWSHLVSVFNHRIPHRLIPHEALKELHLTAMSLLRSLIIGPNCIIRFVAGASWLAAHTAHTQAKGVSIPRLLQIVCKKYARIHLPTYWHAPLKATGR